MLARLAISLFCISSVAIAATLPQVRSELSKPLDTGHLDVRDKDGVSLRDLGATSWVHARMPGHPHLGGLIVTSIKRVNNAKFNQQCGFYVHKVLDSIKYHLSRRHQNSFASTTEAKLYSNLNDNENGQEILTNAMRVLGNYTLEEGIMSGTLWTIDDQNHFISCEENIYDRLDEHSINEFGDALVQGDMAVTSSLCRYSEQSSKTSDEGFAVGTRNCLGITECQFSAPDEAVHFCNFHPECTMVMGKENVTGCEGGLGCYIPKKGEATDDDSWSAGGGRTYIKQCPGTLLQVEDRTQHMQSAIQSLKNSGGRWVNGVVNYCFGSLVDEVSEESFHIAVERVKKQVPCLTFNFVERINDTHCIQQPSIIVQTHNAGCWSYVGQVSGNEKAWATRSQPLNLGRGCELPGIAIHELAHALGMVHENSRSDRGNVMKLNDGNITEGKERNFATTSETIKYAWAGHGTCPTGSAHTKVSMTVADCTAAGGEEDQDASSGAMGTHIDCLLDICSEGTHFPAPPDKCTTKVASMSIKMERKDCDQAQGRPVGGAEHWDWVDCGFDLCSDMGLHLAKPFSCGNKISYGYIQTQKTQCTNMGGSLAVQAAAYTAETWVNCYMDFCSGEFDAPFDFLSLMMYSPYSWSTSRSAMTLEPLGEHSARLSKIMGQRMGFSALDVFHLGHMYGCWDKIKPDFDSKDVSRKIGTGEFFTYTGKCEDQDAQNTGFDIHGDEGYMKHASCTDLMQHCQNDTMGEAVRKACPVSCFECMPEYGLTFGSETASNSGAAGIVGSCFDAENTGIRFRDGPAATCKNLLMYCNHTSIGLSVQEACKLTCGLCDAHVFAPFFGPDGKCEDEPITEGQQFTIEGKEASCWQMQPYCQGHTDSYIVRRKCPQTCGMCQDVVKNNVEVKEPDEIYIPGDEGGCNRRRRYGFCSTRRRRNVGPIH